MRQQQIDGILITCPTREDVEALKVGDLAPNCFGGMAIVKEITYRGVNLKGKAYVGYYAAFGDNNGSISGSLIENQTVSTVPLINRYHQACLAPKLS